MNRLRLLTIALLGFSLSFASCKKDDDQPLPAPQTQTDDNNKQQDPPEPTKEELLTAKRWSIKAIELEEPIEIDGLLISDLYGFMQECQKDDQMEFNIDGTGTNHVNTVCFEEEDSDFLWYFNPENEEELWIDGNGVTEIYTLIEITEEHLILGQMADIDGEEIPVEILLR